MSCCGRGPDPRHDVACEALQARIHLLRPPARGHRPRDEIGDAVLLDECGQLAYAMRDVADDPRLGNPRTLPGESHVVAGLGEEPRVELAAVALGPAHRRPISGSSVTKHERMMPTRKSPGLRPASPSAARHGSSAWSRGPCGRRWQPNCAARRAPAADIAASHSGGPPGCT